MLNFCRCKLQSCCLAQSKNSFIAKISIVFEEVDESHFWVEFVITEQLIRGSNCNSMLKKADELIRIFISSRKTAKLGSNN